MRHVASNVLSILIVCLIAVVVAIGYAQSRFTAEGPLEAETIVQVPRGGGLVAISDILAEAGAIRDPMLFRLAAKYKGVAQRLKFGEYAIPPRASMEEVLAKLVEGDTISHRITVAEGLTSWEIVQILNASEVLTGEVEAVPPEGSLAPNTYFVNRGDSRQALLRRMQADQGRILTQAWEARDPALPLSSPEEVLVLASIVEKETGVAAERPQVASVFHNRLRRGMRLQSDPTVIYGVTNGEGSLGRGITRADLNARNAYNTYQIDRLPPTPIANPGRDAIMAVVNPVETPYIYFVADGTGGHAFSETLEEHNRNVARWRRIEREREQNQ